MTAAMFRSPDEFKAAIGRSFGPTDWLVVEQSRIDQFADATGDHQWIHVDVERAKTGPFGGTIAHGYLTLSLVNLFLPQLKGQELGTSSWVEITQDQVNLFADATGDHQWIHIDVERAKAESPFGGPIAHGYLTLSLLIPMWKEVLSATDMTMAVNYGLNKVRFPAPVPVGAKVRLTATLTDVEEITGGSQLTASAVIEREGGDKPVCIAEPVYRYYGG